MEISRSEVPVKIDFYLQLLYDISQSTHWPCMDNSDDYPRGAYLSFMTYLKNDNVIDICINQLNKKLMDDQEAELYCYYETNLSDQTNEKIYFTVQDVAKLRNFPNLKEKLLKFTDEIVKFKLYIHDCDTNNSITLSKCTVN